MKRLLLRLGALALGLCLLAGTAFAGVPGLDDTLAGFFDGYENASLEMTLELKNLPPFEKDALAMCNGALKNIAVNALVSGQAADLRFLAKGEEVFSLTETAKGGMYELTTSLLPNRLLVSGTSVMEGLFPVQNETETPFDLSLATAQAEERYQALTDLIAPFADEKKANYKIADIGHAKWVRLARLTVEQSAGLLPQLIDLLGCGMDADFQEQLQGLKCKKGFTIALYRDKEDGQDMAVYMKGNVSLGEDDSRTLTYQWAFLRGENQRKDTYKLELARSKRPVERRLIEASAFRTEDGGEITVKGKTNVTVKNGADTVVITETGDLKGKRTEEQVTLSGSLATETETTRDGETVSVSAETTPDLTMTMADGAGILSGSVGYGEASGKQAGLELVVTLAREPAALARAAADEGPDAGNGEPVEDDEGVIITIGGSSLNQNQDALQELTGEQPSDYLVGQAPQGMTSFAVPAALETVGLDEATPEKVEALRQEMYQNAAGRLLLALAGLEGEDGALFRDNMTDGDYASLLTMLNELR